MMQREPIHKIELKDVCMSFTNHEVLFNKVNLELPINEIIWVRGNGKSVFLKMLLGLQPPTSGQCLINNKSIYDMSFEEFLPTRLNCGYSFDFGGLINNRDIISNLMMATEYHQFVYGSPDQFNDRVQEYLEIFDLKSVMRERPSAIIGGLRKATCVARAFVHSPELIALDDPTTGLRKPTVTKLKELIKRKMKSGEAKHFIIASSDNEFMNEFKPIIINVENIGQQLDNNKRAL